MITVSQVAPIDANAGLQQRISIGGESFQLGDITVPKADEKTVKILLYLGVAFLAFKFLK